MVASAAAPTCVAIEVFVEQNQIAPVGIGRVAIFIAVTRSAAVCVGCEYLYESSRKLGGDFVEVHIAAGTCWAFDLEVIAVEIMIALERFDNRVVDGEPNRAAPVGIATERVSRGFAGIVIDAELTEL